MPNITCALLPSTNMTSSMGSSWPSHWTCISYSPALAEGFFTISTTWEAPKFKITTIKITIRFFIKINFKVHRQDPGFKKQRQFWKWTRTVLCANLEGQDGEGVAGRFKREETCILMADSRSVWQKPTQHCKAIIVQLKILKKNRSKKRTRRENLLYHRTRSILKL